MIPYKQTRFGRGDASTAPGNCWITCIASILEIPIEDLPDEQFHWDGDSARSWGKHQHNILLYLEKLNLTLITVKYDSTQWFQDVYHIVSGPSPRGDGMRHGVVGYGVKLVHDPHPDNTFILGEPKEWSYTYFVKIDPAK